MIIKSFTVLVLQYRSKKKQNYQGVTHTPESGTRNLHKFLSIFHGFFHMFSLIHISYNGTECSCIWQKKLACTDHNCAVWLVGSARLYLQLASSIVFIVSRVCFGSFWYQKLPWIYVTPITQQKFITLSDIKPITGCTMSTLYCNGMPQPLQAIMKNAMAGASIQCSDKTQKLLSMI